MKVREPQWLQSGGSIPKFQQPASPIWRHYLFDEAKNDYDRYVTTPDLWDKTHDVDRIFNDVTAIEGFATNWDPETLNSLNSVNKERTLNKTGYNGWNTSFDKLGLNRYFGREVDKFNYMGPTTWSRIAFIDKLKGKYNSKDNTLKTKSGDYYFDATQNKWIPTTDSRTVDPTRLNFGNQEGPQKQKLNWSDWVPLTMMLAGDSITNSYVNQQQKKMKFPLREAPYLQHRTTGNYLAETQLNQAAQEARQAAGQHLTSDINQNLRIREQAEKQAGEYEKQAAQLKANTFARESQLAEETRNKNILSGVETANYNTQQNAAAWNNILNANQQQASKNLQSINSYIGNMYESLGETIKTKRLNEQGYQKAYNQYLANKKSQKAREAYTAATSDITKWSNLEGALEAFLSEDNNTYRLDNSGWQATGAAQIQAGLNDAQKRQFINWLTNGTSAGAQLQRTNWQRYQDQLKSNWYDEGQEIQNWLAEQNLKVPNFVTDQWNIDWKLPSNQVSPLWTPKKKIGGTIIARNGSKLSEFTRQYSRELQHVRRSQDERNKNSLKHLDKQLERLNKEQILLLRSAFK